jgi:hypothetical protein
MNIENFTRHGNPLIRIRVRLKQWLAALRRRTGLLPPPVAAARKHRTGHRIHRGGMWLT